MPGLDYALLANYVHGEAGMAHVIGAGMDTIHAPVVPTGQNMALLARLTFTRNECDRPHRLELIFMDEDGERLFQVNGVVTPPYNASLPVSWPTSFLWTLNFGVPLPRYGLYAFELLVNDTSEKTLSLRVIPAEGA